MGANSISRSSGLFKVSGSDWVGTNGPVFNVRGWTSGSIFTTVDPGFTWVAVSSTVRDPVTGAGTNPGTMRDAAGVVIPSPILGNVRWSMFPYEFFFFPHWQITGTALSPSLDVFIHLKG